MPDALTALGRMQTLWAPRASQIARSEIAKFIASVGGSVVDYKSFHAWSASDIEGFWGSLWDYARIIGSRGSETIRRDPSGDPGLTLFFPGARLNVAENLLRDPGDRIAACYLDAGGGNAPLTIDDLRLQVARVCDGLVQSGIGPGDVVVSTLPGGQERLIAYLACLARGAAWAQIPDDTTADEAANLIAGVNGKILFADASCAALISAAAGLEAQPGNETAQLACLVAVGEPLPGPSKWPIRAWDSFGDAGAELEFQRIAFNDPAVILFEDVAGVPESVTHSAGGLLITHLKEHRLHGDVKKGDIVLSMNVSDPRLWLWQISVMASGAVAAFLDGGSSASFNELRSATERLQATHLILDPATMNKPGDALAAQLSLPDSLRVLFLADEVHDTTFFDRIYTEVVDDIMLCPMAGSPRFLANFFAGSPLHPVRRGEYSALALGMALHVLDNGGRPVVAKTGELVCCEAFPTMPKARPFGEHGTMSGGLPIGRRAQITCYGSGVLSPPARDGGSQVQQQRTHVKTKQSDAASVAVPAARV
ncbi:AMP-binding protein [Hoeflea sp.]|uniref:AMP-binding protein n=1 Tax=Hoeflea sp. TaxID=1940281 RepID=UPI003B024994